MKNGIRTIAIAGALMFATTALPSLAAATMAGVQDQEHRDRDQAQQQHNDNYGNNRYYKLENREGYQDYHKKEQRKEHSHKYRNDDDRQAHDYGYQQGWQGQRGYNNNSERPH